MILSRSQLSPKPLLRATAHRFVPNFWFEPSVFTDYFANFQGTPPARSSYSHPNADNPRDLKAISGKNWGMKQ